MIELEGSQGRFECAFGAPASKGPGVVLIHEAWGLNPHIRGLLDRFVDNGMCVIAPNLYRIPAATDLKVAMQYASDLPRERALADIATAADFVRSHPQSNGEIGLIGFCMGGTLTLRSAATIPGIRAACPFYGIPVITTVDWSRVTARVQGHYAAKDKWATPELARLVQEQIASHGGSMELHIYEADHAFVNETRPVYNREMAELALSRAIAFLNANVA